MRAIAAVLALCVVVGLALRAQAGDAPSAQPPKAPPALPALGSAEAAADAVLAAVAAKDAAALKVLAAKDDPDPWLVAEELVRRAEHDAAEAFAKAAPRPDTEALPAYVASRRGKVDDAARRERLAKAIAALAAGRPRDAHDAAGTGDATAPADLIGVLLRAARAEAKRVLGHMPDAARAWSEAADAAERMGWLSQAALACTEAAKCACAGAGLQVGARLLERARALHERRGDRAGVARALGNLGIVYDMGGDYAKAMACYEQVRSALQALGDRAGAAKSLTNMGVVCLELGDYAKAAPLFEEALAEMEALGDRAGAADALQNLGSVHAGLGDHRKALAFAERARSAKAALGDRAGAAGALVNVGNAHFSLGDRTTARSCLEQAFSELEACGDRMAAAAALAGIAHVHAELGDFPRAMACYERVLAARVALGDRPGAADTLGAMATAYARWGAYAKALSCCERSLGAHESLGRRSEAARQVVVLAGLHMSLGDHARGLSLLERAYAMQEAAGNRLDAARALSGMATAKDWLGDASGALSLYDRARQLQDALGDREGLAATWNHIGLLRVNEGDLREALRAYEAALALRRGLGDRRGEALVLANTAVVHAKQGDYAKALSCLEAALRTRTELGDLAGVTWTLGRIAAFHLAAGEPAKALPAARRAAALVPTLLGGLGDEAGAEARSQHADVFAAGTLAALALGDAAAAAEFLEGGRAGSLREALGSREALQTAVVPQALVAAEAQARAKEAVASRDYERALGAGDGEAVRARRADLEAAQRAVADVVDRAQREAKAAANVLHFEPDPLDAIRARLGPEEAFVAYGLYGQGAAALVATAKDARVVALPAAMDVEAACDALRRAARLGASDAARGVAPEASPDERGAKPYAEAAANLRRLVADPLGIPKEARRVLVLPDGALGTVPLSLLFPDREVVCIPSGTTYGLLLADGKARGEGVLALGDPDYGTKVDERAAGIYQRGAQGGRLTRLPATAAEARAVGQTVLLGKEATEAGLRDALAAHGRWRAVHFACHGLVNPERPDLSSLALTCDGEDDGFLTTLEVFRTKIPADLVVLSACETATGKVAKCEGILGFTRAFMFAGAPRVLCSLWKVDDEATAALMGKFYELWNPKDGKEGLPAAAALRQAQAFVRAQPKWSHPYYWAAWVLWGLPE